MSLKQVDRLYRKMIVYDSACTGRINSGVRSELFHVIMDDIDRLQKKAARLPTQSEEYRALDSEICKLLLKEIQIIIDDYIVSQQQGTLDLWSRMYGDIKDYIRNFYLYSRGGVSEVDEHVIDRYGFYMHDETRT